MKTISTLLVAIVLGSNALLAQSSTARIGLNVLPLFDRTLELHAALLGNTLGELYMQGGYTFPTASPKDNTFGEYYWEGTTRGAYLRLGARAFLNQPGRFRFFFGAHITNGYVKQVGENNSVLNCIVAPCPPLKTVGQQELYRLSAGLSGGVQTAITQRLAVEMGIQGNAFIGVKPELLGENSYLPGYGRRALQATAVVTYTLKGH